MTIFQKEDPNFWYIALEKCEAKDLGQYIADYDPHTPVHEAIDIMKDITEGLKYLHNLKDRIVHRDIKPANILYTKEGSTDKHIWKIADFGNSKILEEGWQKSNPTTGVSGTLGWKPPRDCVAVQNKPVGIVLLFIVVHNIISL